LPSLHIFCSCVSDYGGDRDMSLFAIDSGEENSYSLTAPKGVSKCRSLKKSS